MKKCSAVWGGRGARLLLTWGHPPAPGLHTALPPQPWCMARCLQRPADAPLPCLSSSCSSSMQFVDTTRCSHHQTLACKPLVGLHKEVSKNKHKHFGGPSTCCLREPAVEAQPWPGVCTCLAVPQHQLAQGPGGCCPALQATWGAHTMHGWVGLLPQLGACCHSP